MLESRAACAQPCCAAYDMEDAMILNNAGLDRGLARGYVYKTEVLDLRQAGTAQHFAVPKPRAGRAAATAAGVDQKPHTIFGQKFPQNVSVKASGSACAALKGSPQLPCSPYCLAAACCLLASSRLCSVRVAGRS